MKLYYDCPTKAAYMAKYFGVKFEDKKGHTVVANGKIDAFTCAGAFPKKGYITKDSLYIFEPQPDDVIECGGINFGMVLEVMDNTAGIQYSSDENGGCIVAEEPIEELTIIQRNFLPFIVPEIGE